MLFFVIPPTISCCKFYEIAQINRAPNNKKGNKKQTFGFRQTKLMFKYNPSQILQQQKRMDGKWKIRTTSFLQLMTKICGVKVNATACSTFVRGLRKPSVPPTVMHVTIRKVWGENSMNETKQ